MEDNEVPQQTSSAIFSAEKPITALEEDKFSRKLYVDALKEAILNPISTDCLVIGITGEWGSGKTSLKNILQEQIRSDEEIAKKNLIAEFDPWLYSGNDELISMMFNDIGKCIAPIRTYIRKQTNTARNATSKLLDTASTAAGTISTESGKAPIPIPMLSSATWSIGSAALSSGFKALAQVIRPESKDTLHLLDTREELKKTLRNKGKRVIVFIDDVDRLTDNEICDLFRTIKMVGDLPNVTYILLYDQKAVSEALNNISKGRGEEYLKKIVQVSLQIPNYNPEVIWDNFGKEIRKINPTFDSETDSSKKFLSLTQFFINGPRDVARFVNTLKMEYRVLNNDIEFNDLLYMILLELFIPNLRKWICRHKSTLCYPEFTVDASLSQHNHQREQSVNKYLESCKNMYTEKNIIDTLFPGATYQNRPSPASNTIYNSAHFYKYFIFSQPDGIIPESDYLQFIFNNDLSLDYVRTNLDIFNSPALPAKVNKYLSHPTNRYQLQKLITSIVSILDSDPSLSHWVLLNIITELLCHSNADIKSLVDSIGLSLLKPMFNKTIDNKTMSDIIKFGSSFKMRLTLECRNSKSALIGISYLGSVLQIMMTPQLGARPFLSSNTSFQITDSDKNHLSNKLTQFQEFTRHYILGAPDLHLETLRPDVLCVLFESLLIAFNQSETKGSLTQIYAAIKRHLDNINYYNLLVSSYTYLNGKTEIEKPSSVVSLWDLLHTLESLDAQIPQWINTRQVIDYANTITNAKDPKQLELLLKIRAML